MMEITFLFPDGREQRVKQIPSELVLHREAKNPSDTLRLVFQHTEWILNQTPCEIRLKRNGVLQFLGLVYEHRILEENGAHAVSFLCHGRAAILQENEVKPETLRMPSLRLMEKMFLQPFRLHAEGRDFKPKQGELILEKGTSCWNAICTFGERFLNCTPVCSRDGTVHFAAQTARHIMLPAVKRMEYICRPYEQVSRVVVQNARSGIYNALYENPCAAGISRVRYISARADTAPKKMIADGQKNAAQMQITSIGFVDAEPGDFCDGSKYNPDFKEMRLVSFRYICKAQQEETEMIFERGDL